MEVIRQFLIVEVVLNSSLLVGSLFPVCVSRVDCTMAYKDNGCSSFMYLQIREHAVPRVGLVDMMGINKVGVV